MFYEHGAYIGVLMICAGLLLGLSEWLGRKGYRLLNATAFGIFLGFLATIGGELGKLIWLYTIG